ncbi:hypothetical protein MVS59_002799 [Salmonella enterica]|nr:hypothetical protein [Salmonella enterica subsp. enterica serovar Rubislaw]EAV1202425.1 hypothetical protein [Salmonella enterica]EBH8950538.1 hypothetical protein [Salmonella enterica subsp. diarizonae serovar 48:i:z]EDV4742912.1 hypothetical protein [Salmonella enterica subsp. enterica serovar Javiana]EAZ2658735.1 hypothetical protein [Salmonella enterica]
MFAKHSIFRGMEEHLSMRLKWISGEFIAALDRCQIWWVKKNLFSPGLDGFDFQHWELMGQAGTRFSLPAI